MFVHTSSNKKKKGIHLSREAIVRLVMILIAAITLLVLAIVFRETLSDVFYKNFFKKNGYINVLTGLGNTLIITFGGFLIGLIMGILVCLVNGSKSNNVAVLVLKQIAKFYSLIFRATPVVVQLLIIYFIIFASSNISTLIIATISFGLNSGAYVSEIIRGGIQAVNKGQMQAGLSLGLSYRSVMGKIILPQAMSNCFPSLCNEFVTLIKETSVAGFIGTVDLTLAFRMIANDTYDFVPVYLTMGVCYFILVVFFTSMLSLIEKKVFKNARA